MVKSILIIKFSLLYYLIFRERGTKHKEEWVENNVSLTPNITKTPWQFVFFKCLKRNLKFKKL